jgi:predicted Zn-dependent protease
LRKLIVLVAGLALSLVLSTPAGWARQGGISLIRDAEIEHIIRLYATPVFEAAGLDPQAVQVHLVNDTMLNAFVAGGQRIFVTTGLLLRAETPNQVIGVLAHETGHIAGGHLARTQEALRGATAQVIASFLLGAVAAAAGSPDAGAAIMMGGQHLAERSLLQYSRAQESSADQAAVTFLEHVGQSPVGLLEFLKVLGAQEALLVGRQDPYVRTHPISADRIAALSERAEHSRFRNNADPAEFIALHRRLQAKLFGFIEPLAATLRKYPESDTSLPARYARTIAYYRLPDLPRALGEIESLIAENAKDAYFSELKGQILFENGRIAEAVQPYRDAVRLAPTEPLLRFSLGQVLVATDDPALNREAIGYLEEVVRYDPQYGPAWQQLAVAYGRDGNLGMSALSSAERFLLQGSRRDARGQAERAMRMMKEGSPGWLRAQDIVAQVRREDERR